MPGFSKIALHCLLLPRSQSLSLRLMNVKRQLKRLFCSAPVLAYPLTGAEHQFIIEMDASV